MRSRRAEQAAQRILDDHGVTTFPTPIEEILRKLRIRVVPQSLPRETSAVILRLPDGDRVIGVNSDHAPTRQRFSLAHELGHALLHLPQEPPAGGDAVVDRPLEVLFRDDLASRGVDRKEIEANAFAAELLMPRNVVRSRFLDVLRAEPQRSIDRVIGALASDFKVSVDAMRFRLVNLGLVDPG